MFSSIKNCFPITILTAFLIAMPAKAENTLFDGTGMATDYLRKALEIIQFSPSQANNKLDPFHIENLENDFQKKLYNPEISYYDQGNPSKYFLKFGREKGLKMAIQYLEHNYSNRIDYFPETKFFSHGLIQAGETEPSIKKRLHSLKESFSKGYSYENLWFFVGVEKTEAMLNSLLDTEEYKDVRKRATINIIKSGTSRNVFEIGLEKVKSDINGNRAIIGDGTYGLNIREVVQKVLNDHSVELIVSAIKDWRTDMNLYNYVEKYHGDSDMAVMAWAESSLDFEIAKLTHNVFLKYIKNQ